MTRILKLNVLYSALVISGIFFLPFPALGSSKRTVLDVPANGEITAVIDGRELTLFSSPGMPSTIYLSLRTAQEMFGSDAQISRDRSSGLFTIKKVTAVQIGPVRIDGGAKKVSTLLAGRDASRQEVRWFEEDVYSGYDSVGGPFSLASPVIRYHLRPAVPGESKTVLPLSPRHKWWIAVTPVEISGQTVYFAFAPQFERSVMSAAVGSLLAREYAGQFSGVADNALISHGVRRPVRPVLLSEPFRLGTIAIDNFLVRTVDYGNIGAILDPNEIEEDDGAIVVTGKSKPRKPLYYGYIGQDFLQRCSYIEFDKIEYTITLSCSDLPALVG